MRELLHIGEVARLVGVSTKTIRYYHEIGLLAEPERTESRYRLYNSQHLLRLQRIRRLSALGLSLKHIRAILGDSSQEEAKSTLRAALQSLVEELSAQILKLEERRILLQSILAGDQLEPVEAGTYFFSSPAIEAQLASSLSAESLIWGQSIDAMLGSFHWPAEYRQIFQAVVQHIAGQTDHYHHLLALEERFAALADFPEDAPEVAQLAEDYASSPDLPMLRAQLAQLRNWEQGPLSSMLIELTTTMISPAQKRFFELLAQKAVFQQAPEHNSFLTSRTPQSSEQE